MQAFHKGLFFILQCNWSQLTKINKRLVQKTKGSGEGVLVFAGHRGVALLVPVGAACCTSQPPLV